MTPSIGAESGRSSRWPASDRSRDQRRGGERGSAAVAMLAIVPVVVLVMVVTMEAATMVAAGAMATGTADLAALAAASALVDRGQERGTSDPHLAAAAIAAANGATMVACACDQVPVEVIVSVAITSPFGLVANRVATGRGRATLVAPSAVRQQL